MHAQLSSMIILPQNHLEHDATKNYTGVIPDSDMFYDFMKGIRA